MVVDLILALIALVGVAVIAAILGRKIPNIKAINTDTIPSEREARRKNGIIEQRLQRKISGFGGRTFGRLKSLITWARLLARRVYWRMREIEREYHRRAHSQLSPSQLAEKQRQATSLLEEAAAALREEKLAEAERRCIEIIALDPKQQAAYQLLGEVYIGLKDYEHAREVLVHASDLLRKKYHVKPGARPGPNQAPLYGSSTTEAAELAHTLASVLKMLDRSDEAIASCEEAVVLAPNNPKYLSTLFDLAIAAKSKYLAIRTLDRLKEVNPDNQRLAEMDEQVAAV